VKYLCLAYYDPAATEALSKDDLAAIVAVRIASLHPAARIGEQIGWGIEVWPIERLVQYDGAGQ
jgi:hypothetical protein